MRGTYALVLGMRRRTRLRVGALGDVLFEPGFLVYVGSAHGSGGLRARLAHHCRTAARPHWHLDHVRRRAPILGAWICSSAERLEHHWAEAVGSIPGSLVPAPGFGSSDCGCPTHLFGFARRPSLARVRRALAEASGGGRPRHLTAEQLLGFAGVGALAATAARGRRRAGASAQAVTA